MCVGRLGGSGRGLVGPPEAAAPQSGSLRRRPTALYSVKVSNKRFLAQDNTGTVGLGQDSTAQATKLRLCWYEYIFTYILF